MNMRTLAVAAVAGVIAVGAPTTSQAQTTIGFDDLASAVIPDGYNGLNWLNFKRLHVPTFPVNPSSPAATSGEYVAYNVAGGTASFSSATGFNLYSAYLTAATNEDLRVDVYGFRGGVEVFTKALFLSVSAPLLADFQWGNVDNVVFMASGGTPTNYGNGTYFGMDDVMVSTVTPEPMTLMLLGTGLAGMVAVRRRRRLEIA